MNSLIMKAPNMLKVGSWGSVSQVFDTGDQLLSDSDKTGSLNVDPKILGDENHSDQVGFDHLDFLDDYLTYSAPKNGEKLANSSTDENDMDFPEWLENKIDFSLLDNFDNIDRILDDPNFKDDLVMEDDELAKLSDNQLDEKRNVSLIDEVENETSKATNISLNLAPNSPPYSTPSSPEGLVPDNSPPCSPLIGSPPNFGNLLITNQIFPSSPIFSTVPTTFTIILPDGNLAGLLTNVVNEDDVPSLEIFETNSQISDISDSSRVLTKTEDCIEIFEETSEISELSQTEGFLPVARESTENNFEGILNDKQNTVEKEVNVVKAKRGRKRKNLDVFDESVGSNSGDYSPPVPKQRKERKRAQNKDAATRYRQKKRAEAEAIGGVEEKLLDVNKTLKDKAQQLSSEISYLKGLMREMFKARGLLK